METEGAIRSFIEVWTLVVASLIYSHTVGRFVPKGLSRLLLILPTLYLLTILPLHIDSPNVRGMVAFFLTWLGNFKLLLFAFGQGPLATKESGSLHLFIAIACFPIKAKGKIAKDACNGEGEAGSQKGHRLSFQGHVVKSVLLMALVYVYDYTNKIHPTLIYFLYCLHIYLVQDLSQAFLSALIRATTGMELEPQFNKPYLSTSLQDFWGRRWNLMVPNILRPTVYEPVRDAMSTVMRRSWSSLLAVLATFLVSGLMHEVMFFYIHEEATRGTAPSWDVMWFFMLHGVCLVGELVAKKAVGPNPKWQLPKLVSGAITVGFVIGSSLRWFMPALLATGVEDKALKEFKTAAAFAKTVPVKISAAIKGLS